MVGSTQRYLLRKHDAKASCFCCSSDAAASANVSFSSCDCRPLSCQNCCIKKMSSVLFLLNHIGPLTILGRASSGVEARCQSALYVDILSLMGSPR